MRLTSAVLPTLALVLLPAAAWAQPRTASDSTPFRRGQWGAEFSILQGMGGAGALRFLSPRTALSLDGRAGFGRGTSDATGPTGQSSVSGGSEQSATAGDFAIGVGVRRYRMLAPDVTGFVTAGAGVRYERIRRRNDRPDLGEFETLSTAFGLGPSLQVGAQYLVSQRLALGATYGVAGTYSWSRQRTEHAVVRPDVVSRGSSVSLATTPLRLSAALYF